MSAPGPGEPGRRPLHPRHGVHAPTVSTPPRRLTSLRRTASTDMLRPDGRLGDLVLVGRARGTIVHEYTVTASVDPERLVFESVEATARALPWVECNPAAASADRLVGRPLRGLRPQVRAGFTGTTTCTHLNDTLRSLEDVEALAAVVTGLGGER